MQFSIALRSALLKKGAAILMGLGALCQMARAQECGTQISPEAYRQLSETREARQAWNVAGMRGTIRWIPVTVFITRSSACAGGLTTPVVADKLAILNRDFAGADVQFYQCGPIREICNDEYNTMDATTARIICPRYEVPNTLNLWFEGSAPIPGWAYFPGDGERVVVSAFATGSVMQHELGHFFGLYHTHGDDKPASEIVGELVNGSNCEYAGDEVCDTPAEPSGGLNCCLDASCVYTGTSVDANGQSYTPDVTNFMGYGNRTCRIRFSPGQLNRISYGANVDRANLVCTTTNVPCGTPVTVYPHTLNFETGLGAWYQGADDNFNWTVQSGATPTAGTGPAAAQQGTQYAYIEATGNTPNKRAELYSPCLDLTYTTSPELSFWYHMEGSSAGILKVEVSKDGGQKWVSVWSRSGNQGTAWVNGIADLSAFTGQTYLKVRIVAYTLTADVGDIAIDNIELRSKPCAGTTASISHTDLGCNHLATGTATATVTGAGGPWTYLWSTGATTASLTNIAPGPYQVTVTASAGCKTVMGTYVEESNFRITLGAIHEPTHATSNDGSAVINLVDGVAPYSITFTPDGGTPTTITGLTGPSYTITGWSGASLRLEVADNIGCKAGDNIGAVTFDDRSRFTIHSLPYAEGFESGLNTLNNPSTNGAYNWEAWTGASPAASTGPSAAASGSSYALLNSQDGPSAGALGKLYLPYADLPQGARPILKFKYHAYGADCQSLRLYAHNVTLGSAGIWWQANGDQGDEWKTAYVDLSYFFRLKDGNTGVRYDYEFYFAGVSAAPGLAFDYAIDDVELYENPNKLNAVISDACGAGSNGQVTISPTGPGAPFTILWSNGSTASTVSGLSSNVNVTVTGADGSKTFEVYQIANKNPQALITVTGQSSSSVNDGTVDLTPYRGLAPYTYLWSNGATTQDIASLAPGTYTVTVTDSRGCSTTANGTVAAGGCFQAVRDFPYSEGFETGLGKWGQVTGDNFDWTRQTGATPTANTGPSSAQSGSYYVFANAANPNNPAKVAYLQSECFDFYGKSPTSITFWYHMFGAAMGTLTLQVSTNDGSTWTDLWSLSGNQPNAWAQASVSLSAYANRYVKFRFKALTGSAKTSDIAVDNIQISANYLKTLPGEGGEDAPMTNVVLYPNPSDEVVNISLDATEENAVTCTVTDLSGRAVAKWEESLQWGSNQLSFEVGSLSEGVYLVEIASGSQRIVKRFVVQR